MPEATAFPRWLAFLISVVVHIGAGMALIAFSFSADHPVPEPEPMAIMVEFVADPTTENEEPQGARKGDPEADAPEEAVPEQNDVEEVEEPEPEEAVVQPEPLPDSIPVPAQRPSPETRKVEESAPDKSKVAKARGLEDDPLPDIPQADELKLANDADATLVMEAMRGSTAMFRPSRNGWGVLPLISNVASAIRRRRCQGGRRDWCRFVSSSLRTERSWRPSWSARPACRNWTRKCSVCCGGPRRFRSLRRTSTLSSRCRSASR